MRSETKSPVRRKAHGCALCRTMPRYNAQTAAAVKEADAIMARIVAGARKPMTLEEALAEIAAVSAVSKRRRNYGNG